jgi:protein SCO1/2
MIRHFLASFFFCTVSMPVFAQAGGSEKLAVYDADQTIQISQEAVGNPLKEFEFTDSRGSPVKLSRYQDKPLLISMIFTSCHHVCPAITKHLATAVDAAREALGEDSFRVITVGFDTPVDTPEAMRVFAAQQDVDDPEWDFLSASADTVAGLVENIGFTYFPSPRGFDHVNQVTVVDRDGVIYRQVYGAAFDLPWLVEPLKELVFNRPQPGSHFSSDILGRIKLFCTVYDPNTGRYKFDYSLFVGMGIGVISLLAVIAYLVVEFFRTRRRKKESGFV